MRFVWMLLLIGLVGMTVGKSVNFQVVKELLLLNAKNATNIYVLPKTVTVLRNSILTNKLY